MLNMVKPEGKQARYVVVIEAVKNLPACFSGADEVHLSQSTHLVGYSRLGHFESCRESADAHLSFDEQGNNPHAAGVAEGAE